MSTTKAPPQKPHAPHHLKLRNLATLVAGPWTKKHCIIRAHSVESRQPFAVANAGLKASAVAAFCVEGHPLRAQMLNLLVLQSAVLRDFTLFEGQLRARHGRLPARTFLANARALEVRLLGLQDAVHACGRPGPCELLAEPPALTWEDCAEPHPELALDGGDLALWAHIFAEASDQFIFALYQWRTDAAAFLEKKRPLHSVPPRLFAKGNAQLVNADGQLWTVLQFLRDHVAEAHEALARSARVRAARQRQREAEELERVRSAPPSPEVLAQLSLFDHCFHEALTHAGVRHWWADGRWQWAPQHAQAAAHARAFTAVNLLD